MSLASKIRRIGPVVSDTRWWPFYLQRRFMRQSARERITDFVAARLRPRWAEAAPAGEVPQRLGQMRRDGIAPLGRVLASEQVTELRAYFEARPVYDPYRSTAATYLPGGSGRDPETHVAYHEAADVVRAPGLLALANRADLLDLAGRLLGCKPTLGYLAAWWSYPTGGGAQQAEHFHRDVDDWRFFKLFVYLTDVGPDNGPHVYVPRSSPSPRLRQIRRFTDAEVDEAFGAGQARAICGQAGEAFLEDTFGIHKGQPVRAGRRLVFQAVYSMFPLPYGPAAPVATAAALPPDAAALDPWVNRLYVSHS